TESGTWGVFQSVSEDESAEVAEARNENGQVIELRAYSKGVEKKFEGLIKSAGTIPAAGEAITVGDWNGLITAVSKSKENTGFNKITVTAKSADSAELTALA
ncbi:MAG: hypothetical protein PHQ27_10500, partial [Victivallales bacterium]|nr:hypothetical protein [Victivallales bacterium]